jgi:DNA primase catalytic core
MPRIPEEELKKLKDEIDLVALIQSKGVALSKQGNDYKGLCPFHDEKTPSFVVTPAKGLWHCFGCGVGGTVVDFVMQTEKVSFRHAVEILKEGKLSALSPDIRKSRPATLRLPSLISDIGENKGDEEISGKLLDEVVGYYHERLFENPQAMEYLQCRCLDDPGLLQKFRVGFSDRTLGLRLPIRQVSSGRLVRSNLQALGILRSSGHEHFRGNITIPVYSAEEQITGIYGRRVGPIPRKQEAKHLYLPGPHRGLFNPHCLKHGSGEILLCEAILDSMSLFVLGYENTTASFGVNGFTEEMMSLFLKHRIKRVYLFYDADQAGDRAALTLSSRLQSEGIEALRPRLPGGFDVNDFLQKNASPRENIKRLINAARPLSGNSAIAGAGVYINSLAAITPAEESTVAGISLKAHPEKTEPVNSVAFVPPALTKAAEEKKVVLAEVSRIDSVPVPMRQHKEDIFLSFGNREYRIRGLARNLTHDVLRVNIRLSLEQQFYLDTFDLYHARNRATFILAASREVGVEEEIIKRDMGRILLKLEELQEDLIRKQTASAEEKPVQLSCEEREAALEFLSSENLVELILADFKACGLIGEEINKLTGYLAAISRKLEEPLAVIIQSSSAAGKTSLMEAILAFSPREEQIKYSAMTGQSLFYMGETDLKQKILAIVEEEGAEKASYALKLLQSEGELMIASTGKDGKTGKLITHEYRVEGPVMIFLTTTAMDIDEEFLNRCLVLTVNETVEQTRAIHQLQRQSQTLNGLLQKRDRQAICKKHQNAQRLLRPLLVANPYANQLTFLSDRTRTRRDHIKYLTLIRSVALLHQYQREIRTTIHEGREYSYIEVEIKDIELANQLCHEVLGRSLSELAPQTRKLLGLIHEFVQAECQRENLPQERLFFTRKEIREYSGWTDNQLKVHVRRLEEMEYLRAIKPRYGCSHKYELLYKGEDRELDRFAMGLINTQTLINSATENQADNQNPEYNTNRLGVNEGRLDSGCPRVGSELAGCWTTLALDHMRLAGQIPEEVRKTHIWLENPAESYVVINHIQTTAQKEALC